MVVDGLPETDERRPTSGAALDQAAKLKSLPILSQPRDPECPDCDPTLLRSRSVYALRMPDGEWSCVDHATAAERALVDEYDALSHRVGVRPHDDRRWGQSRAWPYGPNIDLAARGRMLRWAYDHRLTLHRRVRCPEWLLGKRCPHRDGHSIGRWRDHSTAWTWDGIPAVLVSHPYVLDVPDLVDLKGIAEHDRLAVDVAEAGWYGHGTYQVTIASFYAFPAGVGATWG